MATRGRGQAAPEPLIERDAELGVIAERLDAARAGHGGLLMIEGTAGIGKSALLRAARTEAVQRSMPTLSARGIELERELAFGIVRQLFERSLARARGAERERLLTGPARRAEALLTDAEAPDHLPEAGAPPAPDPGETIGRGLDWLCANIAERDPLLLSVDDAQWADERSLRWIAHLAPRLDELPVAILLAVRSGEPVGVEEILDSIRVDPAVSVIRPEELSVEGSGALLGRHLAAEPTAEIVSACRTATGGNPFLLHELSRELSAREAEGVSIPASRVADLGPEAVARSALLRLRRLSPDAGALARSLAVLAEGPFRRVAAHADLSEDAAAEAVDGLVHADLVDTDGALRFVHPVVRAAIYGQLAPLERARAHKRAARLLRGEGAGPDQVAAHLIESEPAGDAWTVEVLRQAAARAASVGALQSSLVHLRRALAEPPAEAERSALLVELGRAEARALTPDAIDHLSEAVAAAPDPAVEQAALLELGRAQLVAGRLEDAVPTYEKALALGRDDREFALQVEAELASAELNLRAFERAAERLDDRRDGLTGGTRGERMLLAVAAFAAAQRNESADRVADLARRALGGSRLVEEQSSASLILWEALFALLMADGYAEVEDALTACVDDARRRGWAVAYAAASCFRAWMHLRRGALRSAEADAAAAIEVGAEHGPTPTGPMASAFLSEVLRERGDLDAAAQALSAAGVPEPIPDAAIFQTLLFARGRLRLARGDLNEGLEDVLLVGRREVEIGGVTPAAIEWRSTAALAHKRLGEDDRARELSAEELELARAFGTARSIGIALRASGLAADGDAALPALREAVDVLAESEARLEHARALVDLGAAMRRTGRRGQARDPLREGLRLATECGASALGERAFEELRASGARPRRKALRGRHALTPSELRVARMAAEGRSNREIAEELFVTVRTVEFHLSRAYGKLEISSRRQLPAALADPVADR